jgi:hypothetical protein
MTSAKDQKEVKETTTITGRELIVLVIFTPVVFTWLFLAARIIWTATTSQETLENIEGLLTCLAILTVPVSGGLTKIFEGMGNGKNKN